MALAIFVADLSVPFGFNVPGFYLVVLWFAYFQGKLRQLWIFVWICSLLTLLALLLPFHEGDVQRAIFNRLVDISLFVFAGFVTGRVAEGTARQKRSQEALELRQKELQDRTRTMLSMMEDLRMEREKLARRESELQAIIESAPVAMLMTDRAGRILLFNSEAERAFGYDRQEVLSKPLEILMPERYRQAHPDLREMYLRTPESRPMGAGRHLFARRKDGSEFPVEVALTPLETNSKVHLLTTVIDISERKRAEDSLRHLSEDLTRQVEERTRDLRQARDAAWEANQAKSTFLANMSHEIRTPMNGIIGMTELLLKTPLSAEQRHYQAIVKESAESLLLLLNDILDLSKIEAGKLELIAVDFDPRDCVGSALQGLGYAAAKKGVELACHIRSDVPQRLRGDVNRLHQILVNLAGNAVKFTDRGEIIIDVLLESLADSQATLHFQVRDTGCGIPAEKLETIFESFIQLDNTARRRHGGTGLGLTISRQLVALMGGRIWVESEVNRGSTFHFTACLALGSDVLADVKSAPLALQGRQILVVDDNAANRKILVEILREWKTEPLVASSGPEAIALLERLRTETGTVPDVVLLDMLMPGMDGSEVARRLREIFGRDAIKIVILSSLSEPLSLREMAQFGVDSLLSKPVRASQLLTVLCRVLEIHDEAPEVPCAGEVPGATIPSLHVLLAEDNRVNRMVAIRLLEERGHTVVPVENGDLALAALEHDEFDVVLMDVQMPVLDGFSATAAIRRKEQGTGRHLPIVALTANAMEGDRERCLASGMDGYVAKPVRSVELYSALESIVKGQLTQCTLKPPSRPSESLGDKVFDAEAFEASIGDPGVMRELISVFFEDERNLMRDTLSALQRRDGPALHQATHTLKGMLGNFSAEIAFECATQLSEQTRDGRYEEGMADLVNRLEAEIARLRAALQDFQNHL